MSYLTGLNLIGSEESGEGYSTFFAQNPATRTELEIKFYEAAHSEIDLAVSKADSAFLFYRAKSNSERADFMDAIAAEIMNLGDDLIKRCMAETALPEARLTGERMRTVNQLLMFANLVREGSWVDARIDPAIPDRKPLPRSDIRQMQVPLGITGIFGASNFPLAFSVAGGDTASALAAGCPVVFKAHPLHPGTSEMVGRAIIKAAMVTGMPDGVFSLLQGVSHGVGMLIVKHPKIAAIGFTGSFRGGKTIFDAACKREIPIPVFAEMGSVNPVFILPGALKERKEAIAAGFVGSVNLGVGQFCTNPGLVITPSSDESVEFLNTVRQLSENQTPGIMLSEQIRNNYLAGTTRLREAEGVSLLSGSPDPETGNVVHSKVFSTTFDVVISDKSLTEEVFGPSTLSISTRNRDEMIRLAETLDGHLTATLHGTEQDLKDYAELIGVLERKAGRLIFNGFPTGVEVCNAMVHGGPYPATTASQSTSVGTAAIRRFSRPVCYQDFPQDVLPDQLKNENPLKIWRLVDGRFTREAISG